MDSSERGSPSAECDFRIQREELAQQTRQLHRLAELRRKRVAETADGRAAELQAARVDIARLRCEVGQAVDLEQARASELVASERHSVELQVQTQEMQAQVEIAQTRAKFGRDIRLDRLRERAHAEERNVENLQTQLASEQHTCQEAVCAREAFAKKAKVSKEDLVSCAQVNLSQEEKALEAHIRKVSGQIKKLDREATDSANEETLQLKQAWETVEERLVRSEQEVVSLATRQETLEAFVEKSRQCWLENERTKLNVLDHVETIAASHDQIVAELRVETAIVGKRVSARMAVGCETQHKLELESVAWQADRRKHVNEELELQRAWVARANQIKHHCEAEMQEQASSIEARSRKLMLAAQRAAEKRYDIAHSDAQRRLVEEKRCGEHRLQKIRHEVAEGTAEENRLEAAATLAVSQLQRDLSKLHRHTEEDSEKSRNIETELHMLYNTEMPGLRLQIQEKQAQLSTVQAKIDSVGPSWEREKTELLAELECERRSMVDKIIADATVPLVVPSGRAVGLPVAPPVHFPIPDDLDDDLPEIPSLPEMPLDDTFGSGALLATDVAAAADDRHLDVRAMRAELAKCAQDIEKLTDVAQLLGGGMSRLRLTEDRLVASTQENSTLSRHFLSLQAEVQRFTSERDRLQDLNSELRSRLHQASQAATAEDDRVPSAGLPGAASSRTHSQRVEEAQAELKRLVEHNRTLLAELRRITAPVPKGGDAAAGSSETANPLSLNGRAADLSPARTPLTVSERSTESQRRKMRAMQLRKQEMEAKREADARNRLRIGWGMPT